MFAKVSRSWALAGQCWDVLKEDKTLVVFPIFAGIAAALLGVSFALPAWTLTHGLTHAPGLARAMTSSGYLLAILFYAGNYFIVIFFNTALVSVALARLEGRDAGVSEGLGMAVARLPVILVYATLSATVGLVLRAIEERVGLVGSIIAGILGFTWTVTTALVVPILAAEGVGPFEAIGRSAELLKSTWGENIVGNASISAVMGLFMILAVIAGAALAVAAFSAHSYVLAVLVVFTSIALFVTIAVVSSTLHTIYCAALYRYATGGSTWSSVDRELLGGAFRAR